ncbi:MAG: redoxin family protein [Armatimonadetes bacterium]|nr:redoxin family protein [Armatimonadota bacterium]
MSRKLVKLSLTAAVLIAGTALVAVAQNKTATFEGKTAPSFKLKITDGTTATNASLKGKVVLLDFWATWCGPCKKASPTMQNLHKTYSSKGLKVIGVSVMEEEKGKAGVVKYKTDHKYTYPFAYEGDDLAKSLKVSSIPQFVLIDKKGKIVKTWEGYSESIMGDITAKVKAEIAK